MSRTGTRPGRAWARLRQAVLPVFLSVAASEIALNLASVISFRAKFALLPSWEQPYAFAVPDERLGLRGSSKFWEHDAWGYRNRAVPKKAEILVIGDSQTYGLQVRPDDTWPQVLARLTGKSLYNMAFPGWGPVQYRAAYKEGSVLGPKIVLMGVYFGNDFYDAFHVAYYLPIGGDLRDALREPSIRVLEETSPLLQDSPEPREPRTIRWFVSYHVKLYALARAIYHGLQQRSADQAQEWQRAVDAAATRPDKLTVVVWPSGHTILEAPYREIALRLDDPRIDEGVSITCKVIEGLADSCKAAGRQLVLVLLPTKELVCQPFLDDPGKPAALTRLVNEELQIRARIKEVCSNHRVGVVDGLQALRTAVEEHGLSVFFPSENGHYSGIGHAAIARQVAARLQGGSSGGW